MGLFFYWVFLAEPIGVWLTVDLEEPVFFLLVVGDVDFVDGVGEVELLHQTVYFLAVGRARRVPGEGVNRLVFDPWEGWLVQSQNRRRTGRYQSFVSTCCASSSW